MKVKLKKHCNVNEHGLLGNNGEVILVSKQEADNLIKKGLADHVAHVKSKEASK